MKYTKLLIPGASNFWFFNLFVDYKSPGSFHLNSYEKQKTREIEFVEELRLKDIRFYRTLTAKNVLAQCYKQLLFILCYYPLTNVNGKSFWESSQRFLFILGCFWKKFLARYSILNKPQKHQKPETSPYRYESYHLRTIAMRRDSYVVRVCWQLENSKQNHRLWRRLCQHLLYCSEFQRQSY